MQKKSFDTPDSTMTPPKTKVDVVKIGKATLMRNTFQPGWKWSVDVKPSAGTDSCQTHHVLCVVSGHLMAVMDNASELQIGPGEVVDIPPGHDAWVIGNEPFVAIDAGAAIYTKP